MNRAIFLDRDGVVNVDYGYVFKIENLQFIDGIHDFVAQALSKDYLIVIVTNQSGIARKFFTVEDFHAFMSFMINQLLQGSDKSISYYFDGTHPDLDGPSFSRKPNPGMLLQAMKELDIDMSKSLMIGDNISDIEAGANAGIKELYLLRDFSGSDNFNQINYRVVSTFTEILL